MNPRRSEERRAVASVTVVGAGRLGRALSHALIEAGLEVFGPVRRGEDAPPADVVIVCVPDAEIAAAVEAHRSAAQVIGHASGATPLAETGADFGLHPLQTFTGEEGLDEFEGIGCAVAGRSPEALEVARELAEALGAIPFPIADEDRAAYHAAASIASNFVVTLEDAAERVAATTGLAPADARALLAPLVRRTVENWAALGAAGALTGPVARGDETTVERQRAAVAERAPELLDLFDVLTDRTRALAARKEPAR